MAAGLRGLRQRPQFGEGKDANWVAGLEVLPPEPIPSALPQFPPAELGSFQYDIGDIFSCCRFSTKPSFPSTITDQLCTGQLRFGAESDLFLSVVLESLITMAQTDRINE